MSNPVIKELSYIMIDLFVGYKIINQGSKLILENYVFNEKAKPKKSAI